jgi:hypothetical protein
MEVITKGILDVEAMHGAAWRDGRCSFGALLAAVRLTIVGHDCMAVCYTRVIHPRPSASRDNLTRVWMQQDITRGRQMVDSLFQGQSGMGGTHNAILTSEEYLSTAQRNFNNMEEGYYISPAFLDKVRL